MGVPEVLTTGSPSPPKAACSKWKWPLGGLLLGAAFLQWRFISGRKYSVGPLCQRPGPGAKEEDFDWYSLSPSAELKWVPCYTDKQCARLEVPLDYSEPSGEQAAIALLRVPASVAATDSTYRGPILFNPGGPGGSGVGLIQRYGKLFHEILGDEYDIVGFDPRGIGYTTPVVNIFGADDLARARWDLRTQEAPLLNETLDALPRAIARAKLYNHLIDKQARHAAQHTNTAVVSRDMLSIVHAHGQEKLQYWGFSYGTILGATFASLYPDKIGRLVVDGVADADDYYKGLWSHNLIDTDRIILNIAKECSQKPKDCPLYESRPSLVIARLEKILNSLKTKPIPVHSGIESIRFIDRKLVHGFIFSALYKPYQFMSLIFEALVDLEKGDGQKLHELTAALEPTIDCKCGTEERQPQDIIGKGVETQLSVMCTDAGPFSEDPEFLEKWYGKLAEQSQYADLWGFITLGCVGWQVEPKWQWRGPIGAQHTSFPLLFVGNTADPVTPLWAAHKISKKFKDSVVLTQDSMGHCSISATSVCSHKAIRAYFRDGTLPKTGTICKASDIVFGNKTEGTLSVLQGLQNEEDRELFNVVRRMNEQIELPRLGGR